MSSSEGDFWPPSELNSQFRKTETNYKMTNFKGFFRYSYLFAGMLFFACGVSQQKVSKQLKTHPLLGAWEMKAVHWISADTTFSIPNAQPGLFTFTDRRYTIMWTPTQSPRTPFKILSKPTDEEIKAGFQSVVFNGGTYEISDLSLVTTTTIAKVPGFEGGQQFYRFQINENNLELTMYDETYPDGTKPEWSGQWKTKFVMEKAK